MKQKDIALIIVVIVISAIISFFVSSHIFVGSANRQQQVPVADSINDQFVKPSDKYFNSQSIDPAQEVQIGATSNQNPFSNTTSGQ